MGSYSSLAAFMGDHPDIGIFRTFTQLNRKNLLYYQAEIAILEDELNTVAAEDRSADDERREFHKSWRSLAQANILPTHPVSLVGSREALQWTLFLKIRTLLMEYNAALLQQQQIDALPTPQDGEMCVLRSWLVRDGYGSNFIAGKLNPERVWDEERGHSDFVVIRESGGIAYQLARFFTYLTRLYDRKQHPSSHVYNADGTSSGSLARAVATLLATFVPIAPIFALAYIDPLWIRLLVILIFTAFLSSLLIFGVRLKADQTLAITLACAAVQVVFVGSTTQWADLRKS